MATRRTRIKRKRIRWGREEEEAEEEEDMADSSYPRGTRGPPEAPGGPQMIRNVKTLQQKLVPRSSSVGASLLPLPRLLSLL